MDQESRLRLAIEAVQTKKCSSIRKTAKLFNVPRSTLQDRLRGRQDNQIAKQPFQRLSVEEEASIKRCILQMSSWGWPMTIEAVEDLARSLLEKKGDLEPLGRNWYKRFLSRHSDLKTHRSRALDQSRKDASEYTILQGWFDLFQTVRLQYGITDDDIYNMDEKGCMKGVGDNTKVIISRRDTESFSIQPGDREWVSIIECINSNNYILPPYTIFSGQRIQESWINDRIDKRTVIQVSPNGWTDRQIALSWLQHFDAYTSTRLNGEYRLLILDGHSSHVSLEFVQFCEEKKIIPLCLPPHSTHILQPLDVGIFGPLAKAYKRGIQRHSIFGATRIDNEQFLLYYQDARKSISRNIPGAWRGAGLVPFDPSRVLQRFQPNTPLYTSMTDENGARLGVGTDITQNINKIVTQLIEVCPTPLRSGVSYIQNTCLTALADKSTLQSINDGLIERQQRSRKMKTKKCYGQARVLTVEEMLRKSKEREEAELDAIRGKERRLALKGKVGFVKLVWKELQMDTDLF